MKYTRQRSTGKVESEVKVVERILKLISTLTICAVAVLVTGCATSTVPFEPTVKQEVAAEKQVETVTREITGSRLKRTVDPDNPNANTLSPVGVMTDEELSRHRTLEDAIGTMINMRGGPSGR